MLTGIAGGLAYAAIFVWIGARLKNPGYISHSLLALGKRSLTFYDARAISITSCT
jgi:uncharacterized protein